MEPLWDKSAAMEAMGSKSSIPPKGPHAGSAREDETLGAIAGQIPVASLRGGVDGERKWFKKTDRRRENSI